MPDIFGERELQEQISFTEDARDNAIRAQVAAEEKVREFKDKNLSAGKKIALLLGHVRLLRDCLEETSRTDAESTEGSCIHCLMLEHTAECPVRLALEATDLRTIKKEKSI